MASVRHVSTIAMDAKRGSVIFFYVVVTVLIKECICNFTGNITGWYTIHIFVETIDNDHCQDSGEKTTTIITLSKSIRSDRNKMQF